MILFDIYTDILSDIYSVMLWNTYSDMLFCILSGILCDILSGILPHKYVGILSDIFGHSVWRFIWHFFWHLSWHSNWHIIWDSIWHSIYLSDIYSDILFGIYPGMLLYRLRVPQELASDDPSELEWHCHGMWRRHNLLPTHSFQWATKRKRNYVKASTGVPPETDTSLREAGLCIWLCWSCMGLKYIYGKYGSKSVELSSKSWIIQLNLLDLLHISATWATAGSIYCNSFFPHTVAICTLSWAPVFHSVSTLCSSEQETPGMSWNC